MSSLEQSAKDARTAGLPILDGRTFPCAPVNKIIPFSLVDGPGSRCSVFLQGCNIACLYCHNPETQRACVHCGVCVEHCPAGALSVQDGKVVWDSATCVNCDTCIKLCPHFSTPKTTLMSAHDVYEQVASYQPFIRGVTVSGGECMLWPEFMVELFSRCKKAGLSTLIDSNGTFAFAEYPELMDVCDGVMLDVKAWDDEVWEKLTCFSATAGAQVKDNLVYLAQAGKLEELRIVVVPGYSDPETTIEGCAAALGARDAEIRLKLIRFRAFGVKGALAELSSPDDARMAELEALAHEHGFENVVLT